MNPFEQPNTPSNEKESIEPLTITTEINNFAYDLQFFDVMTNDLVRGEENGPYTNIRKAIIEKYSFEYEKLKEIAYSNLSEDEKIKQASELLKPLLEKFWNENIQSLNEWKQIIDLSIEQKEEDIAQIFDILEKFYGQSFQTRDFSINLLPHPIDNEFLAEPSQDTTGTLISFVPSLDSFSIEKKEETANMLITDTFHEMSHQQMQFEGTHFDTVKILFEQNHPELIEKVRTKLNDSGPHNLILEAITNYIDSYINNKYFEQPSIQEPILELNVYNFGSLMPTTLIDKYITEGKEIDKTFMVQLFEEILDLEIQ